MERIILIIHRSLIGLFLITTILSCNKDFDFDNLKTDDLNAQWGIPLINSTLTLADFLNDTSGIIQTDENGAISLVYRSNEIFSIQAWERTKINDTERSDRKTFEPIIIPKYGSLDSIPVVFNILFDLTSPGQSVDSMFLKKGEYVSTITTNFNWKDANVKLYVPNFVHSETGEVLFFELDLSNPDGADSIVRIASANIADYYAQFENEGEDSSLLQKVTVYSWIFPQDNPPANYQDEYWIELSSLLKNIEYSKFYGYIGQHTESYTDTITLDIFNSVDFGSIDFDPDAVHLSIDFFNELSIPMQIEATRFSAYKMNSNDRDSVEIVLDFGSDISNKFEIFSPVCDIEPSVFTNQTALSTNLVEAVKIAPNKIYYELTGLMNPDGDNTEINCFRDTSDIGMQVTLQLDLFGSLINFGISEKIEFSVDSIENLAGVEFKTNIVNGFPVTAVAQIEFLDANGTILTTLFSDDDQLIQAGSVGGFPDYRVTSPGIKKTYSVLDGEKLASIYGATELVLKITLNTPNSEQGDLVKIYDDYDVKLNLSAKMIVHY